ncbi:MAG: hypothetical protein QOD39_320 [Mycobacterium sp.]|nr:hypothetical protein [Mycobacterium sp.]
MATGLLTVALAVAAHEVGGGGPPAGAAAVQLAVLAATIGALAAVLARAADARVLVGLLTIGQLVGHLMLSAVGHHHTPSTAPPAAAMLAAHLLAIAVGAVLIAAGDRLCRAVSRTARAVVRTVYLPVEIALVVEARRADQPLRSALLLAASVSHRGPPVSFAR